MLGRGVLVSRVVGTGCLLVAAFVGVSGALAVHAPALLAGIFAPAATSLPWCWWPCVVSLVAVGVLAFAGARSAERCRRVVEDLATPS